MNNKPKYPKEIADFYKQYAHLEKLETLKLGLHELFDPQVSDDTLIGYFDMYSDDPDEYLKVELVEFLNYSEKSDIKYFKDNFVPLIKGDAFDSHRPVQVFGVFLDEESEGFPVYIIPHGTENPQKYCHNLTTFIQSLPIITKYE